MKQNPLSKLTIRSAVVRASDLGNILACDLKKEEDDVAHAYIFKWQAGDFVESSANFNAHAICCVSKPKPALVFLSAAGEYGIHHKGGSLAGDIFENSQPLPQRSGFVGFRSLQDVAGMAYAVGLRGMVYRLDKFDTWTRIDQGLPQDFNIQSIHGFDASDIYTVGRRGQLWHYDGKSWIKHELPTNKNLNTVRCGEDGNVYIGGHGGILIVGRGDTWSLIDQEETTDHIWDLEWFDGCLYLSTMANVYRLGEEEIIPVDFGDDPPKRCYQLSAAKGVMWSVGEYDILSYDGDSWSRVV